MLAGQLFACGGGIPGREQDQVQLGLISFAYVEDRLETVPRSYKFNGIIPASL